MLFFFHFPRMWKIRDMRSDSSYWLAQSYTCAGVCIHHLSQFRKARLWMEYLQQVLHYKSPKWTAGASTFYWSLCRSLDQNDFLHQSYFSEKFEQSMLHSATSTVLLVAVDRPGIFLIRSGLLYSQCVDYHDVQQLCQPRYIIVEIRLLLSGSDPGLFLWACYKLLSQILDDVGAFTFTRQIIRF